MDKQEGLSVLLKNKGTAKFCCTNEVRLNIAHVAKKIRAMLTRGVILSISGPLGVGKTTLIRHILPEFEVASPSFLHMLVYGKEDNLEENFENNLFAHIDAYTFKSRESFLALSIEELLETHCIIIEWGELVADIVNILDAKVIKIEIGYENGSRVIDISSK